jgi:hypothetical protein
MTHPEFIQALRVHAAEADRIYSKATAAYLRGAADRMEAMAEALESALDDMRDGGQCVCLAVKEEMQAALLGQDGG